MRFAFSPDQELFRDSLRGVLARDCTPRLVRAAWTTGDGRVPGLWPKLAALGVVGLTAPERAGGLGMNELDLTLLLEECGRAALPEPIVESTAVAAPLLAELGIEPRLLEDVAGGRALVAVGLEPTRDYVSHAHICDRLLLARGDELHVLARDAVGLDAQPSVDGARRLFRVRWAPSAETRAAGGAETRAALARAFDRGALGTSAVLIGLARQMLDMTVDHVKVRRQFGSAIGSFQAVKHHLAGALVAIELARPLVARAAYGMARGEERASTHVSMAKASASDAALLTARVALQCHGAIGYSFEHDLHLWMKRAWALASSWGDAAWHRRRVGASLRNTATTTGGT